MIEQFSVCSYSSSLVVVLTNTVFNDVESILIAPVKSSQSRRLVNDLQIPCRIDKQDYFIDLLDIATVSRRLLKTNKDTDLSHLRNSIKAGIDLLIDGF
ncbi:MAG: CcdB family protein [Aestuariibacter sp.]